MVVVDLAVPWALARHYPGYSTMNQTISTLSGRASPVRLWAAVALGLEGVLVLVYAAWARAGLAMDRWAARMFVAGVAAFGVGTVIASVAPEDPPTVVESASGRVHGIASGLGFLLIMVALAATWWIPDLRTVRRTIVGLFLVAVVTFALFLASEDVTTGWLAPTGLYQRLNLVAIYAGLVVVAWVLRRGAGDRGPAAPTLASPGPDSGPGDRLSASDRRGTTSA